MNSCIVPSFFPFCPLFVLMQKPIVVYSFQIVFYAEIKDLSGGKHMSLWKKIKLIFQIIRLF